MAGFAAAPRLCVESLRAASCWRFCGGWKPEAWLAFDALQPVPDWHMTLELMTVLRDHG